MVASLDYLYPLYKQANTYPYLHQDHVSGNPEYLVTGELHQKAWEVLASDFDEERRKKTALFKQLRDTETTSTDPKEIIPEALRGRVDALFLSENDEIWGVYDQRKEEVRIHESQNLSNTSLTNLAAIHVFLNGGKVYLEEQFDLPGNYAVMNALYRY